MICVGTGGGSLLRRLQSLVLKFILQGVVINLNYVYDSARKGDIFVDTGEKVFLTLDKIDK